MTQQKNIRHKVPCSKLIKGMTYLTEPSVYPGSRGDIWCWTWADDNNIYIFGGDEAAIDGKIGQTIKIEGIPPHYKCTPLGISFTNQNFPLRRSFLNNVDYWAMPSGAICIDGRIYLFVNKSLLGEDQWWKKRSPVRIVAPHSPHFQPVSKAYLLYSDDHGVTWIGDAKNKDSEFFLHKFAWPTFINFGKNYEDARDDYVYATSNDGYWDNGSCCYLARVPKFEILDRDYWEFYMGMNEDTPIWTKDLNKALAMFSDVSSNFSSSSEFGHIGSFEVVYNKGLDRYLMLIWSHSDEEGFKKKRADIRWIQSDPYFHITEMQIYESREPWGPWSLVHDEHKFGPPACYNPRLPTKWIGLDGKTCWMLYGGNWCVLKQNLYGIVTRKCRFELN